MRDVFIEGSTRYVSVSALINQLDTDMRASGRGGYRPNEVPGLVQEAISRILDRQREQGSSPSLERFRRAAGLPTDDDTTDAVNSR